MDARRLRRRRMDLDVRARLGRQAEVDDGGVAHLLDGGYRISGDGPGAGNGGLHLGEVPDAWHLLFDDLGGEQQMPRDTPPTQPRQS